MRYFITGATGFIGGYIARQLVRDGHRVTALVRDPGRADALKAVGVELAVGDITDRERMRAPMTGVDGVFHVAAWYKIGARDRRQAESINVRGTRNVLELMKELGIPKGVYTSTVGVYGDTHGVLADELWRFNGPFGSVYERTKWIAHYEVAEPMMRDGLPLVNVLPGLTYGPGDTSSVRTTLLLYLKGKLPMTPSRTAFCWGHVEDTARAHILAMEKGRIGEDYVIAGPPYTLIEAFRIAEQITGVRAPKMHPSPGLMRLTAAFMALVEKIVPLPEMYSSEGIRATAGVTYIAKNDKAKRELGWCPRLLEEGLRQTFEHERGLAEMH